jgi:hypothetical protein
MASIYTTSGAFLRGPPAATRRQAVHRRGPFLVDSCRRQSSSDGSLPGVDYLERRPR